MPAENWGESKDLRLPGWDELKRQAFGERLKTKSLQHRLRRWSSTITETTIPRLLQGRTTLMPSSPASGLSASAGLLPQIGQSVCSWWPMPVPVIETLSCGWATCATIATGDVMIDNASFHHSPQTRKLWREAGWWVGICHPTRTWIRLSVAVCAQELDAPTLGRLWLLSRLRRCCLQTMSKRFSWGYNWQHVLANNLRAY